MIEQLSTALLAIAGINFGVSLTAFFGGLTLKHYRAHKHKIDLPVYQDLPRGVY